MADVTTRYSFPFQEATDPPAGHTMGQDLAEAVEDSLGTVEDDLDTAEAALTALTTRVTDVEGKTESKPIGRIYQGSAQSIPHNTATALTWDNEVYDTASQHDTSTNPSRVTPNVAGYYRFRTCIYLAANTDYTQLRVRFRVNGSDTAPETRWGPTSAANAQISSLQCEVMLSFNGSTDYIEVFVQHTNGATAARSTSVANPVITLLEWEFVRSL